KRVYEHLGDKVHIELFGCAEDDPLFQNLERNFKYNNNGELTRLGVAAVLQRTDCFIDLSDYQAFGRTGLEAMACGATLLSTMFGGVREYTIDKVNCREVDVFDEDGCINGLLSMVSSQKEIMRYKMYSIKTASNFNINKAAISEVLELTFGII
ncbi:MAG: glycosyltransferase, partial [Paraglaciecola sp.]|nr:glycosyltransferase [Paraglaciecola sp.]